MTDINLPISQKSFNVHELSDYNINFQVIQHPTEAWIFVLKFYPIGHNPGLIEQGEYDQDLGHANKISNIDVSVLYSKETFSQWEYAAESAIDIIELLGFIVEGVTHIFDVAFWDSLTNKHVTKHGQYIDQEFRLVVEGNSNG